MALKILSKFYNINDDHFIILYVIKIILMNIYSKVNDYRLINGTFIKQLFIIVYQKNTKIF